MPSMVEANKTHEKRVKAKRNRDIRFALNMCEKGLFATAAAVLVIAVWQIMLEASAEQVSSSSSRRPPLTSSPRHLTSHPLSRSWRRALGLAGVPTTSLADPQQQQQQLPRRVSCVRAARGRLVRM